MATDLIQYIRTDLCIKSWSLNAHEQTCHLFCVMCFIVLQTTCFVVATTTTLWYEFVFIKINTWFLSHPTLTHPQLFFLLLGPPDPPIICSVRGLSLLSVLFFWFCIVFFMPGKKKKKNTGKILGYHFLAISSSFSSWERALIPHYTSPLHQTDFCQVVQTTRVQGLNPAGTNSCRKLSRMSKKLVRFFVCVCVRCYLITGWPCDWSESFSLWEHLHTL